MRKEAPQVIVNNHVARHPLTGMWLRESVELPRVLGVMIDNHVDARPQSGIDQAFLVIEAPVEGGISRLLAFFDANESIAKIGPVRSARPYFIDWNNEFDALYAHVGGSDSALEKIVSGGTFDVNEFAHSSTFWRAGTRLAPHNTYTSTERLNAYTQTRIDAGYAPEVLYETWQYKDAPEPNPNQKGSSVSIDFLSPVYTADWAFDAESGTYLRSQAGKKDLTLDGKQITANNIGIVITDISVIDGVGRRVVRTIGEGKGFVMQDGKVIDVTWKKSSESQRLKFFVGDQEVVMNPGKTWIEIVPSVYDVTFQQQ